MVDTPQGFEPDVAQQKEATVKIYTYGGELKSKIAADKIEKQLNAVAAGRFRQRQRPFGRRPFDEEIDRLRPSARRRRPRRGRARRRARGARREWQDLCLVRIRPSATRRGTRISAFSSGGFLGAVAVERELEIGFDRHAEIAADGIAELEMQRGLLAPHPRVRSATAG